MSQRAGASQRAEVQEGKGCFDSVLAQNWIILNLTVMFPCTMLQISLTRGNADFQIFYNSLLVIYQITKELEVNFTPYIP